MKSTDQRNNISDPFEKTSPKKSLSAVAFRYLPFWPVFLITIAVSLAVSFFYIRSQTPIFEANATILLKDQNSGPANANVLEALGMNSGSKKVENEIEVLKSRILLEHVVEEMGIYAKLYTRGTVRDFLVYPAPVKFMALHPEALQNSGDIAISFKYVNTENAIMLNGKKYLIGVPANTPYGEFVIVVNKADLPPPSTPAKEYYLQISSVQNAANNLMGTLSVSASKESSLIALKVTDPVPFRAEDILRNLINIYNQEGIADKNEMTANTIKFIENRLITVTKDLSSVEDKQQEYLTKQGIIDLPAQGRSFLDQEQQNDQNMGQIQLQLDILSEVEKYIVKKGDLRGTVPATMGITDPFLVSLLNQLYASELDLDRQLQTSGENSPTIVSLKRRIEQLKSSLLENIQTIRQGLVTTQKRYQSLVNKNSGLLKGVPQQERDLLEITRQAGIKNGIYTFLLQKREEAELSKASAVADSRVINYAESNYAPVKPIPLNIYMVGLAVGIFVGVLYVLIREQFNQEVLFRSDIEGLTNTPILAEIMHDESSETLVIKDGKRTIIAEQLRALRTSLNYIGIQGDKKTILFTSSISGEGKSFMAVNLAVSLALTGKKVILLEFDLRKPKVSKMLNIAQEPGISNYLAGLASLEEIAVEMETISGLFILPAGSIPPNPTELMLNGRLDVLMDDLKRGYDYVLIDSPPIGLVTDAKILNKYADACLYMVRHKYTPKFYLNLIESLYANREMNNLNVVFNGIKARGVLGTFGGAYGSNYGYGYGYGGGYGYGYTQDDIKEKKGIKKKITKLLKKGK